MIELSDERCNQEYHCGFVNNTYAVTGLVSQTAFPTTRNGIISLGCTGSIETFTQCGTCNYEGPDNDLGLKNMIQNAVIQKMFVR